ncbi:MAG: hypothetical protein ACT4PY_04465 [Armatimonadota bacterium]
MAVRTQIYLPEAMHQRLKSRGRILRKSMATQVREAVERYLEAAEVESIPDDPIWNLPSHAIATPPGAPTDIASRHDVYLYGWSTTPRSRSKTPSRKRKRR